MLRRLQVAKGFCDATEGEFQGIALVIWLLGKSMGEQEISPSRFPITVLLLKVTPKCNCLSPEIGRYRIA